MITENKRGSFKLRRSIDGIHLFNRDTGLNVLLDDIVPPADTWTYCPRQISIALTNACNLSCPHCYAPKTPAELPIKRVKDWMSELDNAGCFGVGFGGGEPLLYPELLDICEFGQDQTGLAITLTTNGLLLTENLIENLKNRINFIRISMDGVGETYERIRNIPYLTLLQRLKSISGKISFGINFVANSRTIGDFEAAVKIAEQYQASEFLILPEEAAGRGTKIDDKTLTELLKRIQNYKGKLQLAISADYQSVTENLNPLPHESPQFAYAHISADGLLKKTSFSKYGISITKDGVMAAFNRLYNNKERKK